VNRETRETIAFKAPPPGLPPTKSGVGHPPLRGGTAEFVARTYSAAVSALRAFTSSRAITASVDMTSPKVR
jgi:hypothetical protein